MTAVVVIAGLAYFVLMVVALAITRGDASIRNLTRAIALYGWAAASETAVLVARSLSREYGWAAVALATALAALYCQHATRKRRALKGERVQAEAERTVRDWRAW